MKEVEDPRQTYAFNQQHTSEASSLVASGESREARENTCVQFVDVTINSIETGRTVLQNVNLEVSLNTLTLVIGSVGTGKSVLMKSFIGETKPQSGQIRVLTKDIAYCGQSVWLPNATIKHAIIGPSEFDEERFETVIQACSLKHDIEQTQDGRDSMTGPNGSKLSGGQRQRVALARAIYSLSPIIVCDDGLSSLDSATSKSVFKAVFGPKGILRKQNRTAILATHATEWLSFADQVIILENSEAHSCNTPVAISCVARNITIIPPSSTKQPESGPEDETDVSLLQLREMVQNPPRAIEPSLYRFYFQDVPRWILVSFVILILLVGALEKFPGKQYPPVFIDTTSLHSLWIFSFESGFNLTLKTTTTFGSWWP